MMEIKDYILAIGITTTFLISVYNLYLSVKNRKNTLREHLYKEQLAMCGKLINAFYLMNTEISKGFFNYNVDYQKVTEFAENIGYIIFQNEYLAPDSLLTLANDTVTSSQDFLDASLQDAKKFQEEYERYFQHYYSLITFIRDYFGIKDLSKENQKLYIIPKYMKDFQRDNRNSFKK